MHIEYEILMMLLSNRWYAHKHLPIVSKSIMFQFTFSSKLLFKTIKTKTSTEQLS